MCLNMRQDNQPNKKSARSAGQSLVETALLLPMLMIVLLGVVDLGRLYYSYITVFNSSREGARWGAARADDAAGIVAHARAEAAGSAVNPSDLIISSVCIGGCTQGNSIKVTVQYNNFQLITTSILGGGTIPMQASTEMEIFGQ